MKENKPFLTGFFAGAAASFGITTLILSCLLFTSINNKHLEQAPFANPVIQAAPSAGNAVAAPAPPAAAQAQPAPSNAVKFDDLDGRPSLGPKNAQITIVEFSDFFCPFCKRISPTMDQLMAKYAGKIRRVWRHYPLSMHAGSDRAHEASECASDQGKFWEYHAKLFENQGQYGNEEALKQLAKTLGLKQDAFEKCLKDGKYKQLVQNEVAKGNQVGVDGTPVFFVNGQMVAGAYPFEYFTNIIDGILSGKPVAAQAPAAPSGPPAPVKFDDLDGRPFMGTQNAPITLVEFSDFHCPFCKRVEPTIDQLMKNYSGKIKKVWRHYPLPMHAGAAHTHEASECAAQQGKFWQYHAKLFETQGEQRDEAALLKYAKEVGLNEAAFHQCLSSGKAKAIVEKDIAKGNQVGVQGTPAVFVNGQLVSGSQPYESFDRIIQSELSKKH